MESRTHAVTRPTSAVSIYSTGNSASSHAIRILLSSEPRAGTIYIYRAYIRPTETSVYSANLLRSVVYRYSARSSDPAAAAVDEPHPMLLKPRALALRAPHPVVVHNHGAVGAGRADAAHKVRRAVRVEIAREEAVGEAWCAPERVVERRLLACSQTWLLTWLHSSVWAEWAWRARSVCTALTRSFSRRARSRSRLRFLTRSVTCVLVRRSPERSSACLPNRSNIDSRSASDRAPGRSQ